MVYETQIEILILFTYPQRRAQWGGEAGGAPAASRGGPMSLCLATGGRVNPNRAAHEFPQLAVAARSLRKEFNIKSKAQHRARANRWGHPQHQN